MNKKIYKIGILILVAAIIVGGVLYFSKKSNNDADDTTQTVAEQNSSNQNSANNQNNNEETKKTKETESKTQSIQSGNIVMAAKDFPTESTNYYLDGEYLAIDPDSNTDAGTEMAFPGETGTYNIILHTIMEDDGRSSYKVYVAGKLIGEHQNQLAKQSRENFSVTFEKIAVNKGDIIRVESNVHSEDGNDHSRGRWEKLEFVKAQ